MTNDQPSAFDAGPRLESTPVGDPSRDAVAALHGYAYQLYSSALAWLDLQPSEELFLEVAEDYAIAAAGALVAVQVKDTDQVSTINAQGVKDTIDGFVNLVDLNPTRKVYVHYLSTSPIGLERSTEDRAGGKATLEYWRQAATSADVEPLRRVLMSVGLSSRAQEFIGKRDNKNLRDELLKRIRWDCGQPSLELIRHGLASRLGRYVSENFGVTDDEGRQLAGVVLKRILDCIVSDEPRRLSAGNLKKMLEDATSMRFPRRVANALLASAVNQLAGQANAAIAVMPSVLEPEIERPLPPTLAPRQSLVDHVANRLRENGVTVITGGSGRGKTIVARLTARTLAGDWHIVDLRNASAVEIVRHLDQAGLEVPAKRPTGVILDDFNEMDDPAARAALIRMLGMARRYDFVCLLTAYNTPAPRTLAEAGLPPEVCVPVPDLTLDEVGEMIAVAGGDSRWRQTIHIAGAFGHPQLVSALISGLRSRSWPVDEMRGLRLFEKSDDVEAERMAARRQLVAAVPEEAKALLYRVSLVVGRFERNTVLALAELAPAIQSPGEQLDLLIGPWVEVYAQQLLCVSPLLANAGQEILTISEQTAIHRAVAEAYTANGVLDVGKADAAFLHGLFGKSEKALSILAYAILSAEPLVRARLSEWITGIRLHRTDQPIFPTKIGLSILLRIAQILLLAHGKRRPDDIQKCWEALEKEVASTPAEVRTHLEILALGKLLPDMALAAQLPDWIGKIFRLAKLMESDRRLAASFSKPVPGIVKPTIVGMLFLTQVSGIRTVKLLKGVFDRLDTLSKAARARLLSNAASMPSDYSLLISHPWLEEHRTGSIDWKASATLYLEMAKLAQKWCIPKLALRCHIARGVMLDEYAQDPDQALVALKEAEEVLGSDPILSRARAKIYYRRKDHATALKLLRDSAEKVARNDWVEQAFMFREAGISAAETGDWIEAGRWFRAGYDAAAKASTEGMALMAVGLIADQGVALFKSGDLPGALHLMSGALSALGRFDPHASNKEAYCHRVIRHAALCINIETTGKPSMINGEPTVIVPGMCSNPDPSDITGLPLGHIDIAWYLLAEAEVAGDAGSAIRDTLRSRLDGKAIPTLEIALRELCARKAILACNAPAFLAALRPFVQAILALRRAGASFGAFSAESPIYGELDELTDEAFGQPEAQSIAADSLLAFGISASLQGRDDAIKDLNALTVSSDLDQSLRNLTAGMAGDLEIRDFVEGRLAIEIAKVAKQGEVLQPDEVFVSGLQMIQRIQVSSLRSHLAPLLAKWLRARWSYAIVEQTFLLRNPATNEAAIKRMLSMEDTSIQYCANFLLVIAAAATTRLAASFREYLETLAQS